MKMEGNLWYRRGPVKERRGPVKGRRGPVKNLNRKETSLGTRQLKATPQARQVVQEPRA